MNDDQIKQLLASEDIEFRGWLEQHHSFEEKLSVLVHKPMLSPDEELEEKTLKKRKLQLKDLIAARIREHQLSG